VCVYVRVCRIIIDAATVAVSDSWGALDPDNVPAARPYRDGVKRGEFDIEAYGSDISSWGRNAPVSSAALSRWAQKGFITQGMVAVLIAWTVSSAAIYTGGS
jgi:hypothetical protein